MQNKKKEINLDAILYMFNNILIYNYFQSI